jgi:hypothetical protein
MTAQDLLDYSLRQLPSEEYDRIERQSASDPLLAERLSKLHHAINALLDDGRDFEPPSDLVARTMRVVATSKSTTQKLDWIPRRVPFRLADFAVAATVLLAGLLTLTPAVLRMRSQGITARCMLQLQQFGLGLFSYATNHGYYPQPPADHPAGYVGIQLLKDRYITDPKILVCPGNDMHPRLRSLSQPAEFDALFKTNPELCQQILEANYAYHVGFRDKSNAYNPVPAKLTAVVPLLADGPPMDKLRRTVLFVGNSPNHGGGGQNVLFSDNHIEWRRHRKMPPFDNDIYLNGNKCVGLGITNDDISLIPANSTVN